MFLRPAKISFPRCLALTVEPLTTPRVGFMPDFDYGPETEAVDFEFIETLSVVSGYAQIILCNVCFLGILALAASKSKPATSFDIPSGFRPDEPPQY